MKYLTNEILQLDYYAIIVCESKTFGRFEVLIDKEDIEKIQKYYWNVKPDGNNKTKFYVQTTEKGKRIHLHRYILNLPKYNGKNCVDHRNGNTLDNRKENLKVCTLKENLQNMKLSKRNKCGIKGVSWCNSQQRWRVYKNKTYLGSFKTVEEARTALQNYVAKIA